MQERIDAIKAKVQECIKLAEQQFSITMPHIQIRFDLSGRAAGMAGFRNKNFYVRFNRNHIALGGKTFDHLLNDTVAHEIAHSVCQAFPKFGRNHDHGWKTVCIALGGNGNRCYSEADAPEAVAANRPYVYITTKGQEVRVTKVIHSKVQKGAEYVYRNGKGNINKDCQYSYMTAPAVAASKKPVVVNKPAVERVAKGSKAEAIRARIAQAKIANESIEAVIEYGVSVLGMTRTLAKTYATNNWNKV